MGRGWQDSPVAQEVQVMQIVIAWTEPGIEVLNTYTTSHGDGINAVAATREILVPKATMWLRDGTNDDLLKALVRATANGQMVFTYPAGEKDPLGRARREILNKTAVK